MSDLQHPQLMCGLMSGLEVRETEWLSGRMHGLVSGGWLLSGCVHAWAWVGGGWMEVWWVTGGPLSSIPTS